MLLNLLKKYSTPLSERRKIVEEEMKQRIEERDMRRANNIANLESIKLQIQQDAEQYKKYDEARKLKRQAENLERRRISQLEAEQRREQRRLRKLKRKQQKELNKEYERLCREQQEQQNIVFVPYRRAIRGFVTGLCLGWLLR